MCQQFEHESRWLVAFEHGLLTKKRPKAKKSAKPRRRLSRLEDRK